MPDLPEVPGVAATSQTDPVRWITLDCYGTMVDWNAGIGATLATLWPEADGDDLLAGYHAQEPRVQNAHPGAPYREVLALTLQHVAREQGLTLSEGDRDALAEGLPTWPVFPDVAPALTEVRQRGWRLAILSNTDPDLLAASVAAIGIAFDDTVTARDAGGYKPSHDHWLEFRRRHAPDTHVHVAASVFHDIEPAAALGLPAIWINREAERADTDRLAELPDLSELTAVLERLVA